MDDVPTLRGLLPDDVSLAEATDEPFELFPGERDALGVVAPRRLRDHGGGRAVARRALALLGVAPVEIPVGPDRAPVWPEGIIGSITHCDGYVAAAVARARDITGLGIDAERIRPLERGVIDRIAHADELAQIARHAPDEVQGLLLFSAKESVFKAWFPIARRWLDFGEARLAFDWRSGAFTARVCPDAPVDGCPAAFDGRFRIGAAHVLTAAVARIG